MDSLRTQREEEHLKKGEAQVFQLQQQVDELRRVVREQMSRQHSIEENAKQAEARYITLRDTVDKAVNELGQTMQVRGLEGHRLKQDIAELQVKVSEPIKPIRELRSQMQEFAETRRLTVDQMSLDKQALERLAGVQRDIMAQVGRQDAMYKDLREAIKITANAQEFYQRELERLVEIQHTIEQTARRQVEEVRELIKEVGSGITTYNNRIARLEDLQRADTQRFEEILPYFEQLREEDERQLQIMQRLEKLLDDRFSLYAVRLEEVRQQSEGQFFNLNQMIASQADSTADRFVSLDERVRAADGVLHEIQGRIEEIKQVEDTEIYDIYQQEESRLLRMVEQAQSELDIMRQQRLRSQSGGLVRRAQRMAGDTATSPRYGHDESAI